MVVGAILLVGVSAMLQTLRADPTPEPLGISGKAASRPATLTATADKEAWLGEAAGRVKNTEIQEQQLEHKLKSLQEEFHRKTEEMDKQLKAMQMQQPGHPRVTSLAPSTQASVRQGITPPPPGALPALPQAGLPGQPGVVRTGGAMPASGQIGRVQDSTFIQPPTSRIRVMTPDPVMPQAATAAQKYWIPVGTIMPVKLLTGLDAPGKSTSMGAEAHPVLMFVEDMSSLPNNIQMDMRECFILGEGVGDLSEERAKIRTRALSCIKEKEQQAIEIPIHGMVTGEDGKVGLRGPVVTREGALLAKALMAGFVNGISRVFMPYQQGFTISNSPAQAFNFPDPQKIGMAGIAGGMGGAAQTLARHYSQLAKDIYPIIEIDAGRQGSVIITEGRALPDTPQ
jgi:conjugal transfer pilus assembly protein TraB